MATEAKSSSAKAKTDTSAIPLAEWIASGIGLLLVGVTVGYMAYSAVTQDDSPPDVQVEVMSIVPLRQGYLARFRATNHGSQPANDVHIIGSHGQGEQEEESEAVVDFLPAGSEADGGLFFSRQPAKEELRVRASGYQEP